MNWLVAIAEFVVNEILAVPAYLIGIITAAMSGSGWDYQ